MSTGKRGKMSFLRCDRKKVKIRSVTTAVSFLLAVSSLWAQSLRDPAASKELPAKDISKYLLSTDLPSATQRSKEPPALSTGDIVQKLISASARRSAQLRGFQGTRLYHLEYRGLLGTREASMQVLATYTAPDERNFKIVSQSGSKLLLNRVLLKLLDSEREAFRNRQQVELGPANYDFELLGTDWMAGGNACYVLSVKPRKNNQFLYRGKIWVDANDFAVVRMEGQPARSPSFWVKDTEIDSHWQKLGDFWLIQHNRSVSHIRMGGMATLTIDYTDYQITGIDRRALQGQGQTSVLPDPSSVTPQR